jgi:tetratricopeptide (TPR) repeat protein
MRQCDIVGAFGWKKERTGQIFSPFSPPDSTYNCPGKDKLVIQMDRIATLNEILSQDPNNTFARYGLAMEFANSGQTEQALAEFSRLLSSNPDYAAGYFMAAQTLVKVDRIDQAKEMLQNGIAAAQRKGDSHAASEMQGMLDEL